MLDSEILQKLEFVAEEACKREGCRLYDLEFSGKGGGRTLRVYIDIPGVGVTIDQCAKVSNGLSLMLDVEDLIDGGAYDLEVSSPGLERVLRKTWHFQNAIGKVVKVSTKEGLPWPEELVKKLKGKKLKGKRLFEGVLVEANDEFIRVEENKFKWSIPRQLIHKSNIIFQMKSNK